MKAKHGLYAVLLVFLALASCGPNRPTYEKLIPSDVALFAVIQNPENLMNSLNEFVNTIGLSGLLGGDVGNLVKNQFGFDLAKFKDAFDITKPAVVTMSTTKSAIPSLSFLFAVKDKSKAESIAKEMFPGVEVSIDGPFDGYLVIQPATGVKQTYPLSQAIDPTVIEQYSDDSVSIYAKFGELKKLPGFSLPDFTTMAPPSMAKIGAVYNELFDSLDWVSYTLATNKNALALKGFVTLKKDSRWGKAFDVAKKPVDNKSLLKVENMFDLAFDSTSMSTAENIDQIGNLFEMFGIASNDSQQLITSIKDYAKTLKGSGYASLNFNVPDLSVPNIELEAIGIQPVTDAKVTSTELAKLEGQMINVLNTLVKSFAAESMGDLAKDIPEFSVATKELGEEKIADTSVKAYQYSIEVPNADESLATNLGLVNSILEKSFETRVTTSGNKFVVSVGNKSKEVLQKILSGEKFGTEIDSLQDAKEALSLLDKDPQVILHININKVLNQAKLPMKFDETKPGLLASFVLGEGRKSKFSLVATAQDVKEWISFYMRNSMGGFQ